MNSKKATDEKVCQQIINVINHVKKEECIILGKITTNEKYKNQLLGQLEAVRSIKQIVCHIMDGDACDER